MFRFLWKSVIWFRGYSGMRVGDTWWYEKQIFSPSYYKIKVRWQKFPVYLQESNLHVHYKHQFIYHHRFLILNLVFVRTLLASLQNGALRHDVTECVIGLWDDPWPRDLGDIMIRWRSFNPVHLSDIDSRPSDWPLRLSTSPWRTVRWNFLKFIGKTVRSKGLFA